MTKNKTRLFFCSLIWVISIALLAWCEWPIKTVAREIDFLPGDLVIIPPGGPIQNPGRPEAIQEERRLILEWMPIMRKGDLSKVKLSFIGSKTHGPDNPVLPLVATNYANIYDSYTINAEARMELIETEVYPSGLSGHVLPEDQDIYFVWTLKPKNPGNYEGTAWFYLKLFPLNGGEAFEQAISAQTVNIKVMSLLGLNSNYLRFLGVIGLVIGLIILEIENIGSIIKPFEQKLDGKRKKSQE